MIVFSRSCCLTQKGPVIHGSPVAGLVADGQIRNQGKPAVASQEIVGRSPSGYYDEAVVREIIRKIQPGEEAKMMSQFAQDIIARSKPEWLQEGMQIGREEGWKEWVVGTFTRLMERKFGANLPVWMEERLEVASLETIETWTDRILDAETPEDVFSAV